MKKSTLIVIAIIYIASIVIINFFGMKTSVYNEIIPVVKIECTNSNDKEKGITVEKIDDEHTEIKIKFVKACEKDANNNITTLGTVLTLTHRVYPDNATSKSIKYIHDERRSFEFYKDEQGRETGLILFYSKASFDVQIMSNDGRKVVTTISIWAF